MRRKDREITDRSEIIEIMRRCDVCRLALNDADYPYIIPLNFGLDVTDEKIALIFHSALEGRKIDLMRADDRASFEMDTEHVLEYDADKEHCTMAYESVVGRGRIRFLDDSEKEQALTKLMEQYHPGKTVPFNKAAMPRTLVYALDVEEIHGKRKLPKMPQKESLKLTLDGIQAKEAWEQAGIRLPAYDVREMVQHTKEEPRWVHFGIGNIFRIFIAGIADKLLGEGKLASGISGVETFDFEITDKIYQPYDNLALAVTLYGDGTSDKQVIGSIAEAVAAKPGDETALLELKRIFTAPSLQMVSFTITEKGYALHNAAGEPFDSVHTDVENGPEHVRHTVSLVTALLYARYRAGAYPLALVSMDNVSHNGEKLQNAVLEIAEGWVQNDWVGTDFLAYLKDDTKITFPWTMIDKITPRPSEDVQKMLEGLGVQDMNILITDKQSYIAPFVNAEGPQYLVVEDRFPNGRPPLEDAGVYMTDRETVNACERMKVTVCLNPLHTALAPYGCLLGYTRFSDVMKDAEMQKLVHLVGPVEGMAVVKDPGILSPQAFIDECINVRFPNECIPDTPQRIVVDTSQMVGIRFGETIKEYVARDGDARALKGIPLAIAGWLRYLLAEDDEGNYMPLSPDPMNAELQEMLGDIYTGHPETFDTQLKPLLSNANIFGSDLYEDGIGTLIEEMFRSMLAGPGSVRETLKKYLD